MKKKSVFVSCATDLNPQQEDARKIILYYLNEVGFEPRALGRSDYAYHLPLTEVARICRQCVGGVVLGFEQFQCASGTYKRGTKSERHVRRRVSFPTAWNHIEAGMLFALGLPMLLFREPTVVDGIFEPGVIDVFTHPMPASAMDDGLKEIFLKWRAEVLKPRTP
jgi:hypothetical protein